MKMVILASYGNDSIALITHLWMRGLTDATILFNDTGWASVEWMTRVDQMEIWAKSKGFDSARTQSIGMEQLVKNRKGWPRNGMQFCTMWLKIMPTSDWLDEHDPDGKAICVVGVRREESKARATFPEFNPFSDVHGGRHVWAPLVDMTTEDRDIILRCCAGIEPLPHRSGECTPGVNDNRGDLRRLNNYPERIDNVERIEHELGVSPKTGKPKTMFRPKSKMGAIGIREVMKWANSDRGEYEKQTQGCDTEWCGI